MYLKYLDADKMGDKVGRLIRDEMNRNILGFFSDKE